MDRVLWIGPRHGPAELKSLLAAQGAELLSYGDAEEALAANQGAGVSCAIVTADWKDAAVAIERLTTARPEVQVLVATDVGVPRGVVLSLWAGASGVLDFKTETRAEIVLQIQESVARHRQSNRERELLMRLHAMNEEFLRNIVAVEKRNLELEDKLKPPGRPVDDGPPRVLIVDDEEIVRKLLERVLDKQRYLHASAADGEAAVELLRQQHYHLVITDKNLPGMSGLDVLRHAKKISAETEVMLMTGYSSKDSAIDALNLGASAYLEKPFDDVKAVIAKIDGVLAGQRERSKNRQYLTVIKERNRSFLEQYRALRADLESWLQAHRGVASPGPSQLPAPSIQAPVKRTSH